MAVIQGQELGSQVQQVENSARVKYMGGSCGQKSVWAMAHTAPTVLLRMIDTCTERELCLFECLADVSIPLRV